MPLKQKQWILIAVMLTGVVLAILGVADDRTWLEIMGFIGIIAGLVLDVTLIRCPHCGTWLGRYSGDYCQSCGEKLNWK